MLMLPIQQLSLSNTAIELAVDGGGGLGAKTELITHLPLQQNKTKICCAIVIFCKNETSYRKRSK